MLSVGLGGSLEIRSSESGVPVVQFKENGVQLGLALGHRSHACTYIYTRLFCMQVVDRIRKMTVLQVWGFR